MTAITTIAGFQAMNDNLSDNYTLSNDIDFTGHTTWTPIGPEGGQLRESGTTTTIGEADFYSLIDTGATFQTNPIQSKRVRVGDVANNDTTSLSGIVVAVLSDTKLTINKALFTTGQDYTINANGDGFTGTFDGGDFTITGFEYAASQSDYGGLFGKINGATIKNLKMDIVTITPSFLIYPSSGSMNNLQYFGALVGGCKIGGNPSVIQDCSVTNLTFSAHTNSDKNFVGLGGLIGRAENLIITNCFSKGTLTVLMTGDQGNASNLFGIAGFIGELDGAITIADCYSEVVLDITGNGAIPGNIFPATPGYIGGFLGQYFNSNNPGTTGPFTITDCYATGNITMNDATALTGGFIAAIVSDVGTGKISNCYATGNIVVTVQHTGDGFFGGFAGFITFDEGNDLFIEDCYATGNVTITAQDVNNVGGFSGTITTDDILRCYATGNITISVEPNVPGNVNFGDVEDVSAFCGQITNQIGSSSGITNLDDCYATGDILITGSAESINEVGGFCGNLIGGTTGAGLGGPFNCNYRGNITATAGIIDDLAGFISEMDGFDGTMQKCYFSGLIDLTILNNFGGTNPGFRLGGFMAHAVIEPSSGIDVSLITDCFSRGRLKVTCPSGGNVRRWGGFIGDCSIVDGKLKNCYSVVTGAGSSSNPGQMSNWGGFYGQYTGGDGIGSQNPGATGTFNCWSAGPITRKNLVGDDDFVGVVGSWGGDVSAGGMGNCAVWSTVWTQSMGSPGSTNFSGSDRGTDEPDNDAFQFALGSASHIVYNQNESSLWDFSTPIWYEHWDVGQYPDFEPNVIELEPVGTVPNAIVPESINFRKRVN